MIALLFLLAFLLCSSVRFVFALKFLTAGRPGFFFLTARATSPDFWTSPNIPTAMVPWCLELLDSARALDRKLLKSLPAQAAVARQAYVTAARE